MSIRFGRVAAVISGAALCVAATVMAPPAQAYPGVVAELFQDPGSVVIAWASDVRPFFLALDIYSATDCSGDAASITFPEQSFGAERIQAGDLVNYGFVVAPLEPGTYGFMIRVTWEEVFTSQCMIGTVDYPVDPPTPPPTPPSAAQPESWLQSYGRSSAADVCLGTWHPSWAEWMNGGRGGFVCNRETFFDASTGVWAFR